HHRHLGLEENVILDGAYQSGGILVDAGDWVAKGPGSEEIARAEDEGCWGLSRLEPPGGRFTGWRRWVVPFFSGRSSSAFSTLSRDPGVQAPRPAPRSHQAL